MMLLSHLKRQHRWLGLDMVAPRTSLVKLVLFHSFEMFIVLVAQRNVCL